jgi:hypothetical protein
MSGTALVPIEDLRSRLTLTPEVASWVCAAEDGAALPAVLPSSVVAEATRLAALAERLTAPVTPQVLRPWLALMAGHYAVQRARSAEEATAWARTTEVALEGMPVGVFTKANLGEIILRNAFWPVAHQMIEVLAPDRDNLERRANALRAVANAGARER